MLVERCWRCLEQPAVLVITDSGGRRIPFCDVCAGDAFDALPVEDGHITDAELRRLLGEPA
ncbi:MAG: hypothetical protein ACT4PW_10630 [Acidimicrobiia bacterium]